MKRYAFGTMWLALVTGLGRAAAAEPARPADALLRLVPSEAAVVLTVEGLRDQARSLARSRLIAEFRELPSVRAWLESDRYRQFEQSCRHIEAVVGVKLTELRDELLGDAVVLAIQFMPDAPAGQNPARGLILIRARDQALLRRLITAINSAQQRSGELARVVDRRHAGTTYYVREYPDAAARSPEWYLTDPDGTFACSNSESLIHAVIDLKRRQPAGPDASRSKEIAAARPGDDSGSRIRAGLGDLAKLKSVRDRLPGPALARLFVDPRPIERWLVTSSRPSTPADVRIMSLLGRHLAAVEYAGAALVLGEHTVVFHAVGTLNPSKLDAWLRRWAGDARRVDPALRRVPATTLALASMHVDPVSFYEAIAQVVPEDQQNRLTNLEIVLTGLLLGQDFRNRILPRLGPGLIAYFDSPSDAEETLADTAPSANRPRTWLFPLVVAVGFGDGAEGPPTSGDRREESDRSEKPTVTMAAALENALRTVLALSALDEKRGQGRSRIVSRVVAGAIVTTLDIPVPFAYAVDHAGGRLVLGTSPGAVARYLECSSDPEAGNRFRRFKAVAFPDAGTFACLDLDALTRLAGRQRDRLVHSLAARQHRPAADVQGDLDQVLALARLFEAAFVTSRLEPDATAVHHTAGLILRDQHSPTPTHP